MGNEPLKLGNVHRNRRYATDVLSPNGGVFALRTCRLACERQD